MASIASNLKTIEYLTQTEHSGAQLRREVRKTNAMWLASQTTVAVCWTICWGSWLAYSTMWHVPMGCTSPVHLIRHDL